MGRPNERLDTQVNSIINTASKAGVARISIKSQSLQIELEFGSPVEDNINVKPEATGEAVTDLTPEQAKQLSIIRAQADLDDLMMLNPAEYEEKVSRGDLVDG